MDGLREVRSYVIHWAKLTLNKLGILCIQQNLGKSLNKNIDKNIDALCKQTMWHENASSASLHSIIIS